MILKDVLPASYRKTIYSVYAVLGFILGATQVGYSTAGEGQPEWLLIALAVFGYAGIALGVTAAANTSETALTPMPTYNVDADNPQSETSTAEYIPRHSRSEAGAVDVLRLSSAVVLILIFAVLVAALA